MHDQDQDQDGLALAQIIVTGHYMNYFAYAFSLTTDNFFVNIYMCHLRYGFVGPVAMQSLLLILSECFQTSHQRLLFSMVST
jgi:hypothetical protein